jgi:ATP-dependent Clp protease, protease subunit
MAYNDYQRQRAMTLQDLLLENRIIFLEGGIDDGTANNVVMKMLFLQNEKKNEDISFYINSPGGYVTSTMAIYDTIQFLECDVATYCIGIAASGAALLLAGGSPGKRFILPHAKVMIHQPAGEIDGQAADIEIAAREVIKDKATLIDLFAKHSKKTADQILADIERDRYLSAPEAVEYGLVDEVLNAPVKKKK